MSGTEPDEQRAELLDAWERAAAGWGRRAEAIRRWGMPVATAMIEAAAPQPGERVLELAAGPGDTGFMAAELVRPGGTLICSDGTEAMLEVARGRAAQLGVESVEFRRLELEWIDLPIADVDVALCRWGVMLSVDPAAALHEMRRVLRPGGRAALAVWDVPAENPWATIPTQVLVDRGLVERPPPDAPGMFALAAPGRLEEMLADAGFVEVRVDSVRLERTYDRAEDYLSDTVEMSPTFGETLRRSGEAADEIKQAIATAATERFGGPDGLRLPGRSLVAVASA